MHNGDTITATYFDASNNSNVTATASIDTVPPVISQVAATTDYYNAKVTLADLQAGGFVRAIRRLASCPTNASYVERAGHQSCRHRQRALANRIYYYQVVSRDQAGNTDRG